MGLKAFDDILGKSILARTAVAITPLVATHLWRFGKRQMTVTLKFNSDMIDYEKVAAFVSANVIDHKFSRTYSYHAEQKWNADAGDDVVTHHGLSLGYGTHYGTYHGVRAIVERSLEETKSAGHKFKEHLDIVFIARSRQIAHTFATELKKTLSESERPPFVQVHINNGSWWEKSSLLPHRRLTSVFTANDAGQAVVEAIRAFELKKDEDHRLGVPHHLGILLHGEPGCGKSSLIHAVATETGRSIYYLNLGSVEADKELTSLLNGHRDWSKIILAIEDIDAAGVKVNRSDDAAVTAEPAKRRWRLRKRKDEQGSGASASSSDDASPVSLSALLNVLDGILCPDGLVAIATTNYPDKLDPALKRKGRFDHNIKLGKLGYSDFVRMAEMFGKDPAQFPVTHDCRMTGSDMRAMIMEVS